MEQGIIIKGIAGFYYVKTKSGEIIECKARGRFRKEKISPLVGDRVSINISKSSYSSIEEIHPRKSSLIRPNVSNVDKAIVVFSLKDPDLNYTFLNKILIAIEHYNIDILICLNKSDLDNGEFEKAKHIYETTGYKVLKVNGLTGEGLSELKEELKGKISVFAGPSGVGKSTISNNIQKNIIMETGSVSEKIGRGKHTTRHAQLIEISEDTYIVDTPGFSSIDLSFIAPEELQYMFKEFTIGECKFTSCLHNKEIGCKVKEDVKNGLIMEDRYNAYINILNDLIDNRRRNR